MKCIFWLWAGPEGSVCPLSVYRSYQIKHFFALGAERVLFV